MRPTPPTDAGESGGLRRRDWLAALAALLAGCGGGVDSGGTGTGAASTLAVGTISGFGSIIVNGVHYDETAAAISDDDGRTLGAAELRLGMRASVLAAPAVNNLATASAVTVQSELGGPIDAIDVANSRLQVLGQRVDITSATVIDGGIGALSVGLDVSVFATLDVAQSRYVATRIEPRSGASFLKIRGVIGSLDLAGFTLTIGALRVDWRNVAPATPSSTLAPGRRVYLQLAPTPATGTRSATVLRSESPLLADRAEAELEGRITAFTSALAFQLDGVPVDASAAVFPNGQGALALGVRVEVHGRLSGGVLIAREVSVEGEDDGSHESFELDGHIASVDAAAQTFVVRGVTVHWSGATRFEDGTAAQLRVAARVEVHGVLDASGSLVEATSIQFDH